LGPSSKPPFMGSPWLSTRRSGSHSLKPIAKFHRAISAVAEARLIRYPRAPVCPGGLTTVTTAQSHAPQSSADTKKQPYFPQVADNTNHVTLGRCMVSGFCSRGFGSCYRITASSLLDRQSCPQPTRIHRTIRCSRGTECPIRILARPPGFHRYNLSLRSRFSGLSAPAPARFSA
jgi:hypothetical protein